MFPRVSPLAFALVGCLIAPTARLHAQLTSKSPFMGPQAANAGPTASAPLQFIGYMDTSEGRLYRIHDPAKKASEWVKLNEKNANFDVLVKKHDDEHSTLTVEHQGKTLTLAQREPKVVSSGTAGQLPPPPVAVPVMPSNVPPAVTQSVVLNPTPADEQKRLEAVAAEVARRRALREQATQQIQGQPAPAPAPVMPQQTARPPGNFPQNLPGSRGVPPPNTTTRQR